MQAKVLVIEDEEHVGSLLRRYFEHAGLTAEWVRTGEEALDRFQADAFDAVVLDIGLPGIDGFEVCRQLRQWSLVPIIMLTAWDSEPDRVAGLEVGADDYVTKPFSPRELVARIKATLRRIHWERDSTPRLAVADVEIDPDAREVTVAGTPVNLTAREFDLLSYLVRNQGVVLSRERLLQEVWGVDLEENTRTVDVHIAQLRRKLGLPKLILTIRGVGYKLAAPADRET